MNRTSSQNKTLFDFATTLTVVGILLYYLGWIYWEKYYLTLSIRPSLIDISFEKIIVTTWSSVIGVFLTFGFAFQHYLEHKKERDFEIFTSIYVIVASIFITHPKIFGDYYWRIFLGIISTYMIVKLLAKKYKINLGIISKRNLIILFFFLFYFFGLYSYLDEGHKEAEKFKKNYCEDIELRMKNDIKLYGKFITFMNNKYFILIEDSDCKKEVIILNDSEVSQSKFLNQ